MINVTEQDQAFANRCLARATRLEYDMAEYREEIEARVREEVTSNLADQINTRGKRIADLEAQLARAVASNAELRRKIYRLQELAAAAKPVLTEEETAAVRAVENGVWRHADVNRLAKALKKYAVMPPKAPPTDKEIESIVSWLAAGVGTTEALVEAKRVIDALRARCGE